VKKLGLSPPWYTLYKKIVYSIGRNPSVHVQPMRQDGANYYIDIVALDGISYPLAAILKPFYEMGNIKVYVEVLDRSGKPIDPSLPVGTDPVDAVVKAFKGGLASNEYFVDAINIVGKSPPITPLSRYQVAVIFKKSVIQFFNDDLSDYYGNLNVGS
jgi:hypothetical protein